MSKILIGKNVFDKTIFEQSCYKEHLKNIDTKQSQDVEENQIIEIEEEYYNDCIYSDFDYINNTFTFNLEKYNARKQKEIAEPRIRELKQLLASQDYKTIKYIQGELTEEEFAEVKAQCKSWRDEINKLERI